MTNNTYVVKSDHAVLCLETREGERAEVKICIEDLEQVINFPTKWILSRQNGKIYAVSHQQLRGKKRAVLLHRFLLGADPALEVDHINGDTLDNTRSNLRLVTHAQNMQNRNGAHKNSKSGVRGVYWCKSSKKWRARIKVNSKSVHVGFFNDLDQADLAVRLARAKYMPFSQEALQQTH